MSIIEFLEKVDELTAGCSQKQLSAVIHELARKWPEEIRGDPADYIRTYRNRYKRFSHFQSEMDGYQ